MTAEAFENHVTMATHQFVNGHITSVQYLLYIARLVEEFDETYKEGERFK